MRYQSKSAISYMFRNFWHLVPIALPFGILMGVFCNFIPESDFVYKLTLGNVTAENFMHEFTNSFTLIRYGANWFLPIVAVLLCAVTESVFVVKISRHMRIGELAPASIKRVCGLLPNMLLYVGVFFVGGELLNFLPAGIVRMIPMPPDGVVGAVIALAVEFAVHVLLSFVFFALICAFPQKYCDNYSFNTALSCSARYTCKDTKYIVWFTLMYPLGRLVVAVVTGLVGSIIVGIVLQTLFFTFLAVYAPCIAFVKYYGYIGRERRDVKQLMFS